MIAVMRVSMFLSLLSVFCHCCSRVQLVIQRQLCSAMTM